MLVPLEEKLRQELGKRINVYRSEAFYLELVPRGIDKAASLSRLLERTRITQEEVIAIGDGFNDVSMIRFAGLGVAMANAQPPVKANAARMGDAVAAKSCFFCADAGQAATRLAAEGLHPDIVMLDPPRKGCDAATLSAVVRMAPRRVK